MTFRNWKIHFIQQNQICSFCKWSIKRRSTILVGFHIQLSHLFESWIGICQSNLLVPWIGRHLHGLASAASGYQRVLEENRKLYNQVQDLKGTQTMFKTPFLCCGDLTRNKFVCHSFCFWAKKSFQSYLKEKHQFEFFWILIFRTIFCKI